MVKGKLEKFIIKRWLILFIILSILILLFFEFKQNLLIGLFLGSILSLLRFFIMGSSLNNLLGLSKSSAVTYSLLRYVINQMLVFFLLVILSQINMWMLCGAMVGVMIVPFIVIVNSITEGLGLTHNNFE